MANEHLDHHVRVAQNLIDQEVAVNRFDPRIIRELDPADVEEEIAARFYYHSQRAGRALSELTAWLANRTPKTARLKSVKAPRSEPDDASHHRRFR